MPMPNNRIERVVIKRTRPHPSVDGLEVVTFATKEGWLRRSITAQGKYPPGSTAVFYPPGTKNGDRFVKAKLVHDEYSHGELEPA